MKVEVREQHKLIQVEYKNPDITYWIKLDKYDGGFYAKSYKDYTCTKLIATALNYGEQPARTLSNELIYPTNFPSEKEALKAIISQTSKKLFIESKNLIFVGDSNEMQLEIQEQLHFMSKEIDEVKQLFSDFIRSNK